MNLKSGLAGLVLGLSGMFGNVSYVDYAGIRHNAGLQAVYADELTAEQKKEQEKKREEQKQKTLQQADSLWAEGKLEDALSLYKTLTCRDILGDKVEHVTYDSETKKNNFDELIYQNHLKKEERKAVLLLPYTNIGDASLAASICMRHIPEVRIVGLDCDVDPILREDNYRVLFDLLGVKDIPGYILYSPFDIVNGESRDKTDGLVKKIDSVKGGPKLDSASISKNISGIHKWIEFNVTSPRADYTYRRNYSNEWQKVYLRK